MELPRERKYHLHRAARLHQPRYAPVSVSSQIETLPINTRILCKKQVRALVLYSPAHIDRLEKAGRFPKRVRLGAARVGWIEKEVLDWLALRIAAREVSA
jgi:prophage regulatory protein